MSTECPICHTGDTRTLGVRSGFPVARCRRCGHTFVTRRPTDAELNAVYERYSYDEQHLDALPDFLLPVVTEKVRSFAPYRQSGRLLDVGFGAGALLAVAKAEGFRPYGIEVSALAVEQAKAHGFADVVQGDFLEAPYPPGHFDVVVMSELIEHLTNPLAFARRAQELLRPGGLLYLTTPHGRGVSGRLLEEEWSVCSPPEHLHLFSKASMRRCLGEAGFETVKIESRNVHPHELVEWAKRPLSRLRSRSSSSEEAHFSPDDRVQGSYRFNAMLVGSPIGRALKRVANVALDRTSLGDGLVVYATTGQA